jgi:hypothetical protein
MKNEVFFSIRIAKFDQLPCMVIALALKILADLLLQIFPRKILLNCHLPNFLFFANLCSSKKFHSGALQNLSKSGQNFGSIVLQFFFSTKGVSFLIQCLSWVQFLGRFQLMLSENFQTFTGQ